MDKYFTWLTEDKTRRNIRSLINALIIIAMVVLYFGLKGKFTLDMLFSYDFGALSLISYISYRIVKREGKKRAFEDECNSNQEIQDIEKAINAENEKITNIDATIEYINNKIDEESKHADKLYTNELINIKNNKRIKRLAKGKDVSKLDKDIIKLEKYPKHNKKYRKTKLKHILDINAIQYTRDSKGATRYYINVEKNSKTEEALGIIRFASVGGIGSIPFIIQDWATLISYTIALIIMLTSTLITSYANVRVQTKTKYLQTIKNKLNFLVDMNKTLSTNTVAELNKANRDKREYLLKGD